MPGEIYYWDGLIIDESVAKRHMKAIMQLKNRELQEAGLDLKQMGKYQIYSIRTSRKGRILFTISEIENKRCLIFLEELSNHEYNKSRFLNNPKALSELLNTTEDEFRKIVNFEDEFIDVDESVLPLDDIGDEQLVYTPVEYYNQEFIKLNDSQKEAKYAKGPAIIEGPPGSGKSCVALSLVANASPEFNKILYVTSSPALVNHMEGMYQSLPAGLESPPGRVVFKSYAQLVHESDPATVSKKSVGEEHFSEWFGSYCTRKQQQLKTAKTGKVRGKGKRVFSKVPLLSEELLDAATVYQEFRTIAAYVDYVDTRYGTSKMYKQLDYERLGEKHQSLFKKEHRSWLYQAYQDYMAYLAHHEGIDVSFYRLKSTDVYDMVVVDEGQDFSKAQIQQIIALTPTLQIYFCRDSHQSLADSQSSGPFIKEHLYQLGHKTGIAVQHIQLPSSYRVFPNAQPLVDKLLHLRLKLIGGRADNLEYVQLPLTVEENSTLGSVYWFEHVPEDAHCALQKAPQSSDLIIITLPQWINEAKAFFNTDLVYTVDQVKGLQFPVVVLYRMAEDEALREANKLLAQPERSYVASSSTAHRPAAGVGNPKFGPPLNRFFTAVTRAQQQIIVIQPFQHQYSHIIDAIKSSEGCSDDFKIELTKQSYSEDNWLQLVQKLIHKKELALAQTIYVHHLKKTAPEFKEFVRAITTPPSVVVTPSVTMVSAHQQAASSSSSSSDAASVSTTGMFSAKKSFEKTSQPTRRRGGRRAQQDSSSSLSAQKSRVPELLAGSSAIKSDSIPDALKRQHFLEKKPMKALFNHLNNCDYPGVFLSKQISCGALDPRKISRLFFFHPNARLLITVDQLCHTGGKPYESLLSQLCLPYSTARHGLLNSLCDPNFEIVKKLAERVNYFLDVNPAFSSEYCPESSELGYGVVTEIRELYFLNTTVTGSEILNKLAQQMNSTPAQLCKKLQNFFFDHLEPDFINSSYLDYGKTPPYTKLALELHQSDESSWNQVIAKYSMDATARKIVRLMVQGNRIGSFLCTRDIFAHLTEFFGELLGDYTILDIFSENTKQLTKHILSILNDNPHWTVIDEKRYILKHLISYELDPASNLAGILRVVSVYLGIEHQLINELFKVNLRFWDIKIREFGDKLPNKKRLETILRPMINNDTLAKKALEYIYQSDMYSEQNRAICLYQFFFICKEECRKNNLICSIMINDILDWFEKNPSIDVLTCYNQITEFWNALTNRPYDLFVAYLRVAHDLLATELVQQRIKQRQLTVSAVQTQVAFSESALAASSVQEDRRHEEEQAATYSLNM
ncbi:hypothetical protein [Legionella worsleiensis]|uniref:DNA helicase n=1 Tax=Legionella worsleiensis TaxID=45076 RepID=A0A0W1AG27_9GAMM|nr:hypothetical protein [Legionella worsleiensis]KTD80232.1 hypothetical protein Lwor_1140 [Legionella worsleiensis]STY31681.1 Uncharacterised protein [Legionella worsleiensis]